MRQAIRLFILLTVAGLAFPGAARPSGSNPKIDAEAFLRHTLAATALRETHRLSPEDLKGAQGLGYQPGELRVVPGGLPLPVLVGGRRRAEARVVVDQPRLEASPELGLGRRITEVHEHLRSRCGRVPVRGCGRRHRTRRAQVHRRNTGAQAVLGGTRFCWSRLS